MKIYKKGQGIVAFVFMLIVFGFIWALWLGPYLAQHGQQAITDNSLTGLEAFFLANLNLWVFLGLLLAFVIGSLFRGNS